MKLKLTAGAGSGKPIHVKVGKAATPRELDEATRLSTERLEGWISGLVERLGKMTLEELIAEYERTTGRKPRSTKRKVITAAIVKYVREHSTPDFGNGAEPESATKPVPLPSLIAKHESKIKGKRGAQGTPKSDKAGDAPAEHGKPARRDPRLPETGTTITREYKGAKLLVRVLDDGFEYEGKQYRSLSALAMEITGAKAINGYLFFQLGKYAKREKATS